MSNLVHIKGNTYYIKGSINCGLYVHENKDCILIDSGLDDSYSKRILRILSEREWNLAAVFNTHSHADHCGGNEYLQIMTEATFHASPFEAAVMENPILEPYYLYSADPPPQLRGKFLQAAPTKSVNDVKGGMAELGGSVFKFIPLPGHSAEHMGLATQDGIVFVGDALFPASVWDKYKIPYFENIENSLKTLRLLKIMETEGYILAHFGYMEEISKLAALNIKGIEDILNILLEILDEPLTREELIRRVINRISIPMTVIQYFLLSSCISAFLTYLTNKGVLQPILDNGLLFWERQ